MGDVHIDIHIHLRLLDDTEENQSRKVSCRRKRANVIRPSGESEPGTYDKLSDEIMG